MKYELIGQRKIINALIPPNINFNYKSINEISD